MRTFELRVYKLRTKEALDFNMEQIYPRHLSSFPLFGIEAQGFWTAKGGCRAHGSSCWPPMRRAKNPARSFGGIRKAQNSLRTSGTFMYQTSLALNRQSSYLQQAPLLSDGKRKQRELLRNSALNDEAAAFLLRRKKP
jgi:hypothetical protein